MPAVHFGDALSQNWKQLSKSEKQDIRSAFRESFRDAWKARRSADAGAQQTASSETAAAKDPVKAVADTITKTTSSGAVAAVKTSDVTNALKPQQQPEVVPDDITQQANAKPKTAEEALTKLSGVLKTAAPDVAEKAGKLVEEVASLLKPEEGTTQPPAQRFPSFDAKEDAGKVDAEDYARRVAIAEQERAKQMGILETVSLGNLSAMSRGPGAYGTQNEQGPQAQPIDLSV